MNSYSDLIHTMGGIVIFSLILINANSFFLNNQHFRINQEYEYTAVALAQGLIDEAKTTAFDQAVVDGSLNNVTSNEESYFVPLPFPNNNGVSKSNFDSFEDYNGYSTTINTYYGTYNLSVSIEYVTPTDFNQTSSTPTKYKQMTVVVKNKNLVYPVTVSYVRCYY